MLNNINPKLIILKQFWRCGEINEDIATYHHQKQQAITVTAYYIKDF
jgi:hypothetical protein